MIRRPKNKLHDFVILPGQEAGNESVHARGGVRPLVQKMAAPSMMKILTALTSHSELGDPGKKTGLRLEEFAAPDYELTCRCGNQKIAEACQIERGCARQSAAMLSYSNAGTRPA